MRATATVAVSPRPVAPRPARRRLRDDDVDLWPLSLDGRVGLGGAPRPLLFSDEVERADRFVFERDRRRFVACREQLRMILAGYVGRDPAELRFAYTEHGKPFLLHEQDRGIRFNVSRSDDVALVAVTRVRGVGVDVERIRADRADQAVAERFFSRGELAALRSLPADEWVGGFFRCWTRKEAYIKARGEGLSLALDRFEVSVEPGVPAALLRVEDAPEELRRWTLHDVSAAIPGYAAALAVEGGPIWLRWQQHVPRSGRAEVAGAERRTSSWLGGASR
jgi:4'-phosphopantetheinyl transferase